MSPRKRTLTAKAAATSAAPKKKPATTYRQIQQEVAAESKKKSTAKKGETAIAPAPALVDTPMNASPAPAPAPEPDPEPPKKRRSLGGMLAEKQRQEVMDPGEEVSIIDFKVAAEIEKFTLIRARILADGFLVTKQASFVYRSCHDGSSSCGGGRCAWSTRP